MPKNDQFQIHRDTVLETCKIETELTCAVDNLNHAVYGIGEGTEFMKENIQISIIKGSIAMIEQQISTLCSMRIPHLNAVTDRPCELCNVQEVTAWA